MDAGERRCLIALSLTPGLGPVRIAGLMRAFGSAREAWGAPAEALGSVGGIGTRVAALIASGRGAVDVDRVLRRADAAGARVLTWLDDGYPPAWRDLRDAPPVVYVRGRWPGGAGPAVAVVGTRRATPYGLGVAGSLGESLGASGAVVVSGLARGIDGAAHAGALRAGGVTVGVLAGGVDVVYPPEHRSLMEAMQARGALVSEAPMGAHPDRRQFARRNRLISGLARAVIVVEGDLDSGALITARYARAQGRPVFAVPGNVYAGPSRGPHRLLAEGAGVIPAPAEAPRVLGLPAPAQPALDAAPRAPASVRARVLVALGDEVVHIDDVAARSGLGAAQVAAALAVLEIDGLVQRAAGQRFARTGPGRSGHFEPGGV